MNLEQQVCSLELSKKLKELEIEQKSLFCWRDIENDSQFVTWNGTYIPGKTYSAFTASELISLLPNRITLKESEPFNSFRLRIEKFALAKQVEKGLFNLQDLRDAYTINYYCDSTECTGEDAWLQRQLFPHNIWDENFCNALAKALIKIYEDEITLREFIDKGCD